MKRLLFIFLLLCNYFLFTSCSGPAPASKITDISQVKADIDIYQSLSNEKDNSVSVILYDQKGKEIGSDSIIVWVNQKKTEYKVMQHLYYSKNYYYRIENILPENKQYTLDIQLKNGKKIFLGSASTIQLSNPKNIISTQEASRDEDFPISWSNLHEVNTLYISKSFKIKNDKEPNIQTFIEEPGDTIKINADGNYIIGKEQLSQRGKRLSKIGFKFTAQKEGVINPRLLKGSYVKIYGYHEKWISFK
ncbi:hypothetical protein C1637_11930 [Chryseobacterium lactis]|uniref:Uncharacterized protein n=1 Tax=Chryseobacterium lactis TaxID=1241981 RepID=A0A3G6RLK3_CHRLC|nr:hypothetical protein [Chryseobacterium lactis]AZA80763.1 hypothetical protein EG342_02010 [Chryseobacterium lactis]AZB05765.1 hypothetical protein EG341_18135 [Chryseobacterium lactis]PNW13516.1 hypothetical protein C1637_11930 [Chryseobacterium lactis]